VAWALTIACVLALVVLAASALRRAGTADAPAHPGLRLVAILGLLQFLYAVATYRIAFDRHLLTLLPTSIILIATWQGRAAASRIGFALAVLPLAWYGIAATHDVHAFSRAAFQTGAELMERGVPARDIDGGYAFDGWWTYEQTQRDGVVRSGPRDPWWIRVVTPGVDSRFVLALSPTLGIGRSDALRPWTPALPDLGPRVVVGTRPYTAWWPFGERRLYVLERRGP
jgi:hypothetical protein